MLARIKQFFHKTCCANYPAHQAHKAEIDALRESIDSIDREIFESLLARAEVVRELGELKRALNEPLRDETREKAILDAICRDKNSLYTEEELALIYQSIFNASLSIQERIN